MLRSILALSLTVGMGAHASEFCDTKQHNLQDPIDECDIDVDTGPVGAPSPELTPRWRRDWLLASHVGPVNFNVCPNGDLADGEESSITFAEFHMQTVTGENAVLALSYSVDPGRSGSIAPQAVLIADWFGPVPADFTVSDPLPRRPSFVTELPICTIPAPGVNPAIGHFALKVGPGEVELSRGGEVIAVFLMPPRFANIPMSHTRLSVFPFIAHNNGRLQATTFWDRPYYLP